MEGDEAHEAMPRRSHGGRRRSAAAPRSAQRSLQLRQRTTHQSGLAALRACGAAWLLSTSTDELDDPIAGPRADRLLSESCLLKPRLLGVRDDGERPIGVVAEKVEPAARRGLLGILEDAEQTARNQLTVSRPRVKFQV